MIFETNKTTGTYTEIISSENIKNILFHYKLIAGVDNTIELQFWGTGFDDAVENTDDDWVNVTNFLTGNASVLVTDDTLNDLSIVDSNCAFVKIKIKYIITTDTPDNIIKIGWHIIYW